MKLQSLYIVLVLITLISCEVNKTPTETTSKYDYEVPQLEYDSPSEGGYAPFKPTGYSFTETSLGDSLTLEERIHIDTTGMGHLQISVSDSIHINYLAVGNYCGFFQGMYDYRNDTIFVWDHEDAYDGCGENCLFRLAYVLPKPEKEKAIISVNRIVREIQL